MQNLLTLDYLNFYLQHRWRTLKQALSTILLQKLSLILTIQIQLIFGLWESFFSS